jgi:hypothetical protein
MKMKEFKVYIQKKITKKDIFSLEIEDNNIVHELKSNILDPINDLFI